MLTDSCTSFTQLRALVIIAFLLKNYYYYSGYFTDKVCVGSTVLLTLPRKHSNKIKQTETIKSQFTVKKKSFKFFKPAAFLFFFIFKSYYTHKTILGQ